MRPWTIDAEATVIGRVNEEFLISNREIKDYLEFDDHDKKLFLAGTKGTGKTLLLKYKADLYFNKRHSSNELKVNSQSLVENLNIPLGGTLDKKTLKYLNSLKNWKNIWRFALCFYILSDNEVDFKNYDLNIPKKLSSLNISGIISEILSHPSLYLFSDFFSKFNILESIVQKEIQNQLVFFIDRLDQGLNDILQDEEFKYNEDEQKKNIAFQIWKYAQFGLLETIYNLNSSNPHIKIYATIRLEALDIKSQNKRNVMALTTSLEYTKEDLTKMFVNNIKLIDKKLLHYYDPTKSIFYHFFGFEEMEHPLATDKYNIKRKEKVVDFILRHSFERPRDIMELGNLIYNRIISKSDYKNYSQKEKSEKIRRLVTDAAHDVTFKEYLSEFVPDFKIEYLDDFINNEVISENVIKHKHLEQIPSEIVNYLYRSGLVGSVEDKHQKFHPAAKSIYDLNLKLPRSEYYFTHPTLDTRLRTKLNYNEFYNNHTIIGNNYIFHPPYKSYADILKKYDKKAFTPVQTAYNSLTEANEEVKSKFPISQLYEYFHKTASPEQKVENIKKTFRILSVIAHIRSIDELPVKKEKDMLVREKYHQELISYQLSEPKYQKNITNLDDNLELISKRIFGRIIALGCILFLEMTYDQIYNLFNHSSYPIVTQKIKGRTPANTLRKIFFIEGLGSKQTCDGFKNSKITPHISHFEKKELDDWYLSFNEHEKYLEDSELKVYRREM